MAKQEKKPKAAKKNRLFRRYLTFSLTAVLLCIVLLGVMFFYFLINYTKNDTVDELRNNTNEISGEIVDLVSTGKMDADNYNSNLLVANMLHLVSKAIDADVFITNPEGEIRLCKDLIDTNMEVLSNGECAVHDGYVMPQEILNKTTTSSYDTIAQLDGLYNWRNFIVGQKVEADGETLCYVYAVAPVYSSLMPFIQQMLKLFFGAALIALLLTFMVAYLFAYNLSHPLQEMARLTRQYAKGDFSERIEITGVDGEMDELAESLNSMAESLSVLEDSRQSFVFQCVP